MEELGSLWSYQESIDELKQKLLYTTLELESLKMEANDEIRKSKESVKNLVNLLKTAYQERDEARTQLLNLMNKILPLPSTPTTFLPHLHPETPLIIPTTTTKANSSITESNSLSDTHTPRSADSIFDTVSSPEFSNMNMADSSNIGFVAGLKVDPGCEVIESFVKGKALPEKGKLLQAVMEAGPLLQTLLVAGPLPRWRNPPPLQPFKIPPVSIKSCETITNLNQKQPLNSYTEMSRGSSQMCSASMLSFNGGSSSSCFNNSLILNPSSGINSQIPAGKRERFQ